jgi:FtsP/CotA-like multicopper oxidase with cupredoxin domain
VSPGVGRRQFLSDTLAAAALLSVPRAAAALGDTTTREFVLTAREATHQVGTTPWPTWTYDGLVPGPEIRLTRGDRVRIRLDNRLPQPTTIHWHGLAVPPAMDGVVGLSQPAVQPGESFTYEFDVTQSGTFFYHSHVGLQLDRGLYGALIVEEPGENKRLRVDREYVLLLDDWLTGAPEEALASIRNARGGMMGREGPAYAGYLLNGTTAASQLVVARGERVRLRLINAASATPFRVGLTGHTLLVTHADGQPVDPIEVSTLVIGMGERYDVIVSATNPGTWPLLVSPSGSAATVSLGMFVYTGYDRSVAPPVVWPPELQAGRALRYQDLRSTSLAAPALPASLIIPAVLSGGMGGMGMGGGATSWTINGQIYPNADPFVVREGARVQIAMTNRSMMPHPMHLHGHTGMLSVPGVSGQGFAKDTVLLNPMDTATLEFTADNPGRWLFHCHNLYHMELGMARVVEYR